VKLDSPCFRNKPPRVWGAAAWNFHIQASTCFTLSPLQWLEEEPPTLRNHKLEVKQVPAVQSGTFHRLHGSGPGCVMGRFSSYTTDELGLSEKRGIGWE
jgi:hypothetical protein